MKCFIKKDAEIIRHVIERGLLDHIIVTELNWHADHAEDLKNREALKIAATYLMEVNKD